MREAQIKTAIRTLIKCEYDTKKTVQVNLKELTCVFDLFIIIYIPSLIKYFQTFPAILQVSEYKF